ncbi:MAG: VOC family protein [Deltaproteobacteria bacterium]|nr:VOC family protein [Deltaproteobacteria bacterium]
MAENPQGRFSWNELMSADAKASAAFYGKLFGWKTEPFNTADKKSPVDYQIFKIDSASMGVAGMAPCSAPGGGSQWIPYIIVQNTDASLRAAKELGAKVLLEVTDIPTVGRIAVIQDPQGAVFGLHQLSEMAAK